MNKTVEQAIRMNEFEQTLPRLEIGDVVELKDVWDGEGDVPTENFSYLVSTEDNIEQWINYEFEVVEEKENELESLIKITNIELI